MQDCARSRLFRGLSSLLLVAITLMSTYCFPVPTEAATLTSIGIGLSSTAAQAPGVTYTINFTPATTNTLKEIDFQFSTTYQGSTRPAGLNFTSMGLGSLTGLDDSWSLDSGDATFGLLKLTRTSPVSVSSGTSISVPFSNITNPAIKDCDSSTTTLTDTCWLQVSTYSDTGSTLVDNDSVSYRIDEEPYLTFNVQGVAHNTTTNGVTSTVDTSSTAINYGGFSYNDPQFATQKITITTNAPNGYIVYAYLNDDITSIYSSSLISPFGATNATWTTPQNWTTPNGTVSNSNTGWFGANITDSDVTGWSGTTTSKFGPISTTPQVVATSSGPQPSGKVTYVTYGFEANGLQGANTYKGEIIYRVQALY